MQCFSHCFCSLGLWHTSYFERVWQTTNTESPCVTHCPVRPLHTSTIFQHPSPICPHVFSPKLAHAQLIKQHSRDDPARLEKFTGFFFILYKWSGDLKMRKDPMRNSFPLCHSDHTKLHWHATNIQLVNTRIRYSAGTWFGQPWTCNTGSVSEHMIMKPFVHSEDMQKCFIFVTFFPFSASFGQTSTKTLSWYIC